MRPRSESGWIGKSTGWLTAEYSKVSAMTSFFVKGASTGAGAELDDDEEDEDDEDEDDEKEEETEDGVDFVKAFVAGREEEEDVVKREEEEVEADEREGREGADGC